jgi:predicted pyridoxine 5'-phosphate oxidase superfamily flavin-nucleotide-binding protein
MTDRDFYHAGNRAVQDAFDSRRIADRLVDVTLHDTFSDWDRAFIERAPFFFLATASPDGAPDCSYKGGLPGFVRIVDRHTLAFPDYDGNGMFRSMGNLTANPKVGLLFVDFERGGRVRVNGSATLSATDPLLADFPGAQQIVRVRAERIFPNCPRYIHRMKLVEYSVFAPREGHEPPVPGWKQDEAFCDALPRPRPPKAG